MAAVASTALAVLAFAPGAGGWALALWALVMAALFAAIDYHWKRRRSGT